MDPVAVPLDAMVQISKLRRGGASGELAKVAGGAPVTVLRNNELAYVVNNAHDCRRYRENEERLANLEAREQALTGRGEVFDGVEALMDDLRA